MNNYEDKPIPLIIRHSEENYQVNSQAEDLFRSITGKIAVVSVAGIYRTGKSFLLNTILLNKKQGFAVGPTTNPKTKGLWVWGKPIVFKNQLNEIINLLVLDSEGLGSTQEDINHDLRLFSLTLLLSSTFLYNTMGSIDQNAIDSLGLVLRLCQNLRSQSVADFPEFHWILRDFSLQLVCKDNKPLTKKQYLQKCLNQQSGDSQNRNLIRKSIRSSFPKRNCSTFVRPLTDQSSLQKLDSMELDELRPEFVEQILEFRKLIFSNIRIKTVKQKHIDGNTFSDLINIYVREINSNNLPVVQTGWKYLCQKECQQLIHHLQHQLQSSINTLLNNLPCTKKQLNQHKQTIIQALQKQYREKTVHNQFANQFKPNLMGILQKKMAKVEEEMRLKNVQQTKNFVRKQFQSIEKRLKQGQFRSIGQLIKQFEIFSEYYTTKCPYEDQISTGLQIILKNFAECALIVYKSAIKKKQAEVSQIKNELVQHQVQQTNKDERYKEEKITYCDQIAKLESKIQQLDRQNEILKQKLIGVQNELRRIKLESKEMVELKNEELEKETISFKKQIMTLQDNFKQYECRKNSEISKLQNQGILKDNEIKYLKEIKEQFQNKMIDINRDLQKQKYNKLQETQLIGKTIENLQNNLEKDIKKYQNQSSEKQIMINKLQKIIDSLKIQIEQINKNYQNKIAITLIQYENFQQKIVKQYEDQFIKINQQNAKKQQKMKEQINKSQVQLSNKQSNNKRDKLQKQKEIAILTQKIDFLNKQNQTKNEKIDKITEQNSYYIELFDEKDVEIQEFKTELSSLKYLRNNSEQEYMVKYQRISIELSKKTSEIDLLETKLESYEQRITSILNQLHDKEQELVLHKNSFQEKLTQLEKNFNREVEEHLIDKENFQNERESIITDNIKNIEQQKKSAQLSLVQLKNYYEMQRERLEKKSLQDRKKYQYNQQNTIKVLENKMRKNQRQSQQEIYELRKRTDEVLEQQCRNESEYEIKIGALQQDIQNQKRVSSSRIEVLQQRIKQICEELASTSENYELDRISFIKKIQSVNFEVSRKEKELIYMQSKKETFQNTIHKKQTQIQSIKKIMNQQIQTSLRKVAQIQGKYQKLNEQYMQVKISLEKQVALTKQRNQFLTAKINQLNKQKQCGISKNLEKFDKQKISELKDQVEKYKAQLYNFQSKFQNQRKNMKDNESNYKKQILKLQKDNQLLTQKLQISQCKLNDLGTRSDKKNQVFNKQIEQSRQKYYQEKGDHQVQLQNIKEKLAVIQEQKNNVEWKLQKQIALINQRAKYAEYQKDQLKKQLEQSQKKIEITMKQLMKRNQKTQDNHEDKKNNMDKQWSSQMEVMRESMRHLQDEKEQNIRKFKEQMKIVKDKNVKLTETVYKIDKAKGMEKYLIEENQTLKKAKETLITTHRNQKVRQNDEWKRRLNQSDKNNKQLEKKNNQFVFLLEKEQQKWALERQNMVERIKNLEDALQWQKNKLSISKNKFEPRKSAFN